MKKFITLLLLTLFLSSASCGNLNGKPNSQETLQTQACNKDNPLCPKGYVCINHAAKGTVFLCAKSCDHTQSDGQPITAEHPVHTNPDCLDDKKTECIQTNDYKASTVYVCNPHASSIR